MQIKYTTREIELLSKLKKFKGKSGLYIIKPLPENMQVLSLICKKLPEFSKTSNIAYIGKGYKLKSTDLYIRSKQEMGWSNFSGATFMKKIGKYLSYSERDNRNKYKRKKTREFILNNFEIELKIFNCTYEELLIKEKEMIKRKKPCFNKKNNN